MNNEVANVSNPFGSNQRAVTETAGARQAQSRELAEIQTKFLMAERFPRDERKAMDGILNAFSRASMAERAQYQYSKGGSDVAGPSIHAAEAMAQQWGNIEFGWRELSRGVGEDGKPYSEVEAFAIDLQSRVPSNIRFIQPHWRDTKNGGYKLKDERDIYELCANMAQRRKRACILSVLPKDVIDSAMEQATVTLNAKADTSPEAMHKMVDAFAQFGVTKEHIEKRIQRRLEAIQPAQVVTLKRIYASLRDEMSAPSDWFDVEPAHAEGDGKTTTLKDIAAKAGKKKPAEADPKAGLYAALVERLSAAATREEAAPILEEGLSLPQDQYAGLEQLFAERFPAA